MARLAGIAHASSAIAVSSAGTATNVSGSSVWTPYSDPEINRVENAATTSPTASPIATIRKPSPSTSRNSPEAVAPNANRMPNSFTR